MENIYSAFSQSIDKLYDKATYLDKYGGSVIITSVTLFVFFLIFSYFYVQTKIKPIKADWINQRCNPAVIPFAGVINAGEGESKIEYTAKNFSECTTSILTQIVGFFLQPIHFLTNSLAEFFKVLGEAIQKIRELFNKVRKAIMKIVETIMHRITNVLIQMQVLTMKIKTVLGKTQGVLAAGLYTTMASYLAMKSFFGAMLEIIIAFLVILAAAVVVAWIFPFTWPFATAATAFFIAIAVPTGITAGWLGHILELTTSNIPNTPGCFIKDTKIKMFDKSEKKIIDIHLGDKLSDGGFVTAKFKILKQTKKLYNLNNVIVTGCHDVYHDTLGWIKVSDYPDIKEVSTDFTDHEYVYCLNTTSKILPINNVVFADWDEVDEEDIKTLKEDFPFFSKKSDIHQHLEGGFKGDTIVYLANGKSVSMKNLKINDVLENNEKIVGLVEIDLKNSQTKTKIYCFNSNVIIGGPNLGIVDKYLGNFNTFEMGKEVYISENKLYHVLTDTGKITISNITFLDYNGSLEQLLWNN